MYHSASRLVAPMTEAGLTALSVEIRTKRSAPTATAASAMELGAEEVVGHGVGGVVLHEGDMLVGGGVEDDMGAEAFEVAEGAIGVDDIVEQARCGRRRGSVSASWRSISKRAFSERSMRTMRSGAKRGDAADEFGADGAAGAGDEHGLAADDRRGDGLRFARGRRAHL
jgi:hypothetical protein